MTATVSIVLLSSDSCYTSADGLALPQRPKFDKSLLLTLVHDRRLLCSENTLTQLPPSILTKARTLTVSPERDWQVNLGIRTFKILSDIFIIVKSKEVLKGKRFKRDFLFINYVNLYSNEEFELWLLKAK